MKTNGIRCGSPAVHERKYCFFHQRQRDLRRIRLQRPNLPFHLPLLEDANSIQMAIQEVAAAVAHERLDNRRAGILLFAFQTAAMNLRNVNFEPQQLHDDADPAHGSEVLRLLMKAMEEPVEKHGADIICTNTIREPYKPGPTGVSGMAPILEKTP